jgi:NCS1 family nucleobase:cation symporter-1
LSVGDLYAVRGAYTYSDGFHWRAIVSLVLGIIPNIPGFLVTVGALQPGWFPAWIISLYSYAWFVGFFVSGVCYRFSFNYKKQVNYVSIDY